MGVLLLGALHGASWAALSPPAAAATDTPERRAQVAADPIWQALIHHSHGRFLLSESGLLIGSAKSPREELDASLQALASDASFRCRYPAREAFLRARFALDAAGATAPCPELDEYRRRAPADQIKLVFVAENLEQPSSIMGHLFLKVAGAGADGQPREHAISFFTDPIGLNFPLYLYQGMVAGMPGYFSLTPYRDHVAAYVQREQRTLWEYELRLDTEQRERLWLHLYELKAGRYKYLFASYNCATLVLHLLGVASPGLLERPLAWVSPKEVVRIAQRQRLIAQTHAIFPAETAVALYAPLLSAGERRRVRAAVAAGAHDAASLAVAPERQALANNLALAEHEQLLRSGVALAEPVARWPQAFLAREPDLDIGFDAGSRYNPANSGGETRLTLGGRRFKGGEDRLELRWLPVSHHLDDDNRSFLHESELKLFEAAVSLRDARRLRLERATLFAALSLRPWEGLNPVWSSRTELAWRRASDLALDERTGFDVAIGRGITVRPQADVDVYVLGMVTARLARRPALAVHPEAGVVVRLAWNLKATLAWRGSGTDDRAAVSDATLAWHGLSGRSIKLRWTDEKGEHRRRTSAGLEWMQVF